MLKVKPKSYLVKLVNVHFLQCGIAAQLVDLMVNLVIDPCLVVINTYNQVE